MDTAQQLAKQFLGVEPKQEIEEDRFTAYKVSLCGNQVKRDYNRNLTIQQVQALPLGKHSDHAGDYVWSYGINNGDKI